MTSLLTMLLSLVENLAVVTVVDVTCCFCVELVDLGTCNEFVRYNLEGKLALSAPL